MSNANGLIFALVCAAAAIVYGFVSIGWILKKPSGNDRMREIAAAIQAGAKAYLNRQYMTIGLVGVILFVLIEFSLIIVPFVFLELRPGATKAALKNAQDWLLSHARKLMSYTALILGAYLVISAVIRLS